MRLPRLLDLEDVHFKGPTYTVAGQIFERLVDHQDVFQRPPLRRGDKLPNRFAIEDLTLADDQLALPIHDLQKALQQCVMRRTEG